MRISDWSSDVCSSDLKLFNPGISEARHYIVQVIMDVVRNYDVDGIHFDDYFYPYPARGEHIPDAALYRRYAPKGMSLEDWRRRNVNMLISELQDSIHAERSEEHTSELQ